MVIYKNIDECISELSIEELKAKQEKLAEILDKFLQERLEMSKTLKELEEQALLPENQINMKEEAQKLHQKINDNLFNRLGAADLMTREVATDFYDDKLYATFNEKYKTGSHYGRLSQAITERINELESKEREVELEQPFFGYVLHQLDLKELYGAAEVLEDTRDQFAEKLNSLAAREESLKDKSRWDGMSPEEAAKMKNDEKNALDNDKRNAMKFALTVLDKQGLLSKEVYSAYNRGDADNMLLSMENTIGSIGKEIDSLEKELDKHLSTKEENKKKRSLLSRAFNAVKEHNWPETKIGTPNNPRLLTSMPKPEGRKTSFWWGKSFLPWPAYLALGITGVYILLAELLVKKIIDVVKNRREAKQGPNESKTESQILSPKEQFQRAIQERKYQVQNAGQKQSRSPDYNKYLREKEERNKTRANRYQQQMGGQQNAHGYAR